MRATTMRVVNGYQSAMCGQQVVRKKGGHITRPGPLEPCRCLGSALALAPVPRHTHTTCAIHASMRLDRLSPDPKRQPRKRREPSDYRPTWLGSSLVVRAPRLVIII